MGYGLCTVGSQQYTAVLRYRTGVLGTGLSWRTVKKWKLPAERGVCVCVCDGDV